jgi:hypothetical protein
MRTLTLRALAALVAAVGLAVGAAAPAGAAPRPQPAQNFQDMCHGELDVPQNSLTKIWTDLFVDCTEKVTVIIRVELWSSYLLPGGAGERYRTGDIDSGVGYNHHWRLEMACKWTANRTAGFYFAKATVWAISERDHSEQSIGTIRTPAWGLPCIDTSIPAGL